MALGGFTLIEVLVSIAVFSILMLGLVRARFYTAELQLKAERMERALLVAQDIYEEMRAVPFLRINQENEESDPEYAELPRPQKLGSFEAYNGLTDSPIHDLIGRPVAWGRDLGRSVRVQRFTPDDRTRAFPPLTPPTGEYAKASIEIWGQNDPSPLLSFRFIRADY